MLFVRRFLAVLACIVTCCGCANGDMKEDIITVGDIPTLENAQDGTGPAILLRCEHAYAQLTSYKGTIVTTSSGARQDGRHAEMTLEGTIVFEAPHKLRLETKRDDFKVVIISDGKSHWEVSPVTDSGGVEERRRLEDALVANQGILRGATVRLPAILTGASMNRENGFLPRGKILPALASKAELAGEERINGVVCYRVVCERAIGTWTLWIDKDQFLIRRLDLDCSGSQAKVAGGGFSGRITELHTRDVYSIDAVNVDVDDGVFRLSNKE